MERKVRFSTTDPIKVPLADGSSVTVKRSLDFKSVESFTNLGDNPTKSDQAKATISFLQSVIIGWDFTDSSEKPIPFDPALIESMDVETIAEIVPLLLPLYTAEKKSSIA